MELKQLEYFLKVAHYESFTRAAEDLYVTQPAISHSVRMLEEELGHELFTRKNQKILLNEKGKCFLPYAQQVFTALGNGKKALDALEEQGGRTVNIVVTQPDLFMELLETYFNTNPRIRVMQHSTKDVSVERLLLEQEIDFCISTPMLNNPNITWWPLLHDPLYLLVRHDHPLAGRKCILLSEIADEPFITLVPGSGYRELLDHYLEHAGFMPNITYEMNELAMIRKMVDLGLGIGLYPASAFLRVNRAPPPEYSDSHRKEPLCAVKIHSPVCEREIGAYMLKGSALTPAASTFFTFCKEYFSKLHADIEDMEEKLSMRKP